MENQSYNTGIVEASYKQQIYPVMGSQASESSRQNIDPLTHTTLYPQQQKSPVPVKSQGKGASSSPRMPKAKAQALASTLKRLVVVASLLSFGGFTWLANSHTTTQVSNSQSSSTTTASSSQSTTTSSGSFFSQQGSGYSFGSSTTSQAPAAKSSVS
jgi:hypothetical protein